MSWRSLHFSYFSEIDDDPGSSETELQHESGLWTQSNRPSLANASASLRERQFANHPQVCKLRPTEIEQVSGMTTHARTWGAHRDAS